MITTDSNDLVAEIHDRMPVILAPADYSRWLSEEPDPRDLMRPFPAHLMRMWPISTRPSIIEPIELATDAATASACTGVQRDGTTSAKHDGNLLYYVTPFRLAGGAF